jgi:hypothetical protein
LTIVPIAARCSGRCDQGWVLGLLLDLARRHPQRSMTLAAHLFARTPAGGAADETTIEDALAGALLDADGELHGRWDALTVSQRRAIGCARQRRRAVQPDGHAPTPHQQARDR